MYFNRQKFNSDILIWENDLKKRRFIKKNTVKGGFRDLISMIKIVLGSIKTH